MSNEMIAAQEVYAFMEDRNIIMSFLGDLSHSVITSLLSSVKQVLKSVEANHVVKKRIYNVVVECLDNVSRHNFVPGKSDGPLKMYSTIFTLSKHENHYKILTGNYVLNTNIGELTERIEKVNSLDRTGLQSLYREKISERSEGGGLGIVDISIKSGSKLSYEFKPVTEHLSFFILQTIVSN